MIRTRKVAKVFLSIALLVVSVFVGIYLWAELNKVPLQDYDVTVTYDSSDFPGVKNVSIYYEPVLPEWHVHHGG